MLVVILAILAAAAGVAGPKKRVWEAKMEAGESCKSCKSCMKSLAQLRDRKKMQDRKTNQPIEMSTPKRRLVAKFEMFHQVFCCCFFTGKFANMI